MSEEATPLENEVFSSGLVELDDSMAQLDANLQHLQQIHETVQCFNESFSSFLYGIQMNAWCVEFPEAPTHAAFERNAEINAREQREKDEIARRLREQELRRQQEIQEQKEEEEHRRQEALRKQQEATEMNQRRQSRYPKQQTTTQKKNLKRPTDYTPNRPTYGLPVSKQTSKVPSKPNWK